MIYNTKKKNGLKLNSSEFYFINYFWYRKPSTKAIAHKCKYEFYYTINSCYVQSKSSRY